MYTYFISDIHLHAESKAQATLLLDFLRNVGSKADAVYILGDLFAIWLGDDLREPYSQQLVAVLQQLAQQNVPLYFMRGNRDFLVDKKFCLESGCKLLADPCIVDLYGKQVLLTHGDQLCTLDLNYQKFRKVVQNPILNKIFLALPIVWRRKLGRYIQKKSKRAPKNPAAYDVAPDAVAEWFAKFSVQNMIHGHTHMPAVHNVGETVRYVLGDWTERSAQILLVSADGFELQEAKITLSKILS